MSTFNLSGASYPIKINDREFQAVALTDRDYEELEAYVQSCIIELARKQLSSLSSEERSELLQAAIKAASTCTWGSPEASKIINTVKGSLRLGWQMIRKHHPNVSFQKFYELATSANLAENIGNIDTVFVQLNTNNEEKKEEEASSENNKSE